MAVGQNRRMAAHPNGHLGWCEARPWECDVLGPDLYAISAPHKKAKTKRQTKGHVKAVIEKKKPDRTEPRPGRQGAPARAQHVHGEVSRRTRAARGGRQEGPGDRQADPDGQVLPRLRRSGTPLDRRAGTLPAPPPAPALTAAVRPRMLARAGARRRKQRAQAKRLTTGPIEGTPEHIIDNIVLPIAQRCGIHRTPAENDAANARHGATNTVRRSDHHRPGNVAWAADISTRGGHANRPTGR
jgi:hypothetical protein